MRDKDGAGVPKSQREICIDPEEEISDLERETETQWRKMTKDPKRKLKLIPRDRPKWKNGDLEKKNQISRVVGTGGRTTEKR